MTETTDRAALLLEATEYPGWSSWCGDIIERLAAALAESERELAKAQERWDRHERVNTDLHRVCSELQQKLTERDATIETAKDLFSIQRQFSADALAMYNALSYPRSITDA